MDQFYNLHNVKLQYWDKTIVVEFIELIKHTEVQNTVKIVEKK